MTHMNFMLEGCTIAQAVGLWPLKAEVRVRSQVSPCEICGGQYGTRTSFSPSTSVFPYQHHSTDAPYSYLSSFSSYQTDKLAKPGNLKEQTSFVYRGTLDRRVLSLFPDSEVSSQPLSSVHSPPFAYLPAGGRSSRVQLAWFTQLMQPQHALRGAAIWTQLCELQNRHSILSTLYYYCHLSPLPTTVNNSDT